MSRAAVTEITEAHLAMVRGIANRVVQGLPPHVDVGDLVGDGMLGLLDAADRFDAGRGVKFETYAYTRIKGAMIDGLRRMRTDDEDGMQPLSLEEAWGGGYQGDDGEFTLADMVQDAATPDPAQAAADSALADRIDQLLVDLPWRWRAVARDHLAGVSPKATAARVGWSASRVSQVKTTILAWLQNEIADWEVGGMSSGGVRRALKVDRGAFRARVAAGATLKQLAAEFGLTTEQARGYRMSHARAEWRRTETGTADQPRLASVATPRPEFVPEPAPSPESTPATEQPRVVYRTDLSDAREYLEAEIAELEGRLADLRRDLEAVERVEAMMARVRKGA